ncbi:MerR family transcriptional regulator [Kitasatospora sp. NPDC002227]|uniref:MerR family transcriptional regulator n=1 Tax=Kitasatospora sp. NPDC002227 TaxID=3154773 RepID=UPI003332AD4E
MDRTNLLPIGQFSQASGLPVTALRHYDTAGVLTPAVVDPGTGYRYYRRDQLRTAQLVRALRQLDIPIERVRELLAVRAAGQDIATGLRAHLAAAERRLAVQRSVLHQVLTAEGRGAGMTTHRISVSHRGPVRALACRATVDQSGFSEFVTRGYQELYTAAGRAPLTLAGPALTRLHGPVSDEQASPVEVCLPFLATAAQPRDLPAGIEVLEIPAGLYASTEVAGAETTYPEILPAYDALAAWIAEHSFTFAGPVQEIYRRWCGEAAHPDNRFELAWPISEGAPAAE